MSYSVLDLEVLTNKLFESDPDYCSKLICLPNILLMRWVSYGNDFQLKFPIDTAAGIEKYIIWWFENQVCTSFYSVKIQQYFLKRYHQVKDIENSKVLSQPTVLMELIWKNRPDLQSAFPEVLSGKSEGYWAWWQVSGAEQYNISKKLPINIEEIRDEEVFKILIDVSIV